MISGTIKGEIMMAIKVFRNGVYARLSASDAKVPSVVARKVAQTTINKLLRAPGSIDRGPFLVTGDEECD